MKSDLCESHGYFEEASKLRRATLSESLCNIFHHPRLIGFGASMELDRIVFCSCYYCCSPLHLRNGKIWAARIEVHTAENQIKLKIHKEVQRSNINPYKLLFEMFTHLCAFFYLIRQFFSIRETSLTFANTHSTTKPAPTRCASSSAICFNLIFFVIRFLTRVFADAMS